jgi:thioredoxin-related protein
MKVRLVVAWLICFWVPVFPVGADEIRSASEFFDQSFGDLKEEATLAREEGKVGVLLMFETDDCPWCKRMKETVLNRARVQDLYHQYFRILSLNTEGDTVITNFDGTDITEKEFALKYNRVRATPVFAFFDVDGNFLTRYTGAVKNIDEFILLAEYVADGHYKDIRFNNFKRNRLSS